MRLPYRSFFSSPLRSPLRIQLRHVLRHACGRYGSTLDYLRETALELRRRGIRDREVERLMRLAGD